ncbi:DeoR/GlpR family DNA-binding transcription regulator [Tepidimicrobium xylanilyticum]|uniref:Transcriptional regulator, DeoR family n=1 Tax=Tepidimicrobium xylanilyticum TaxID=1123352 RepID=A0A1H3FEK1_9FIRM|nr:DeoR/GlpR family DNA-binding transcription regulator [Tepidimicrobium xylanilyticum]SDX88828.1 transcriptional regulator, DeoR family [Tepidimicrobium xylanilyticum]
MKKAIRRKKIMEVIQEHPITTPSNLASIFGVSIETIRNDLNYLEEMGWVIKVHGGVAPAMQRGAEVPYDKRETVNIFEKKQIAKEALKLIKPGDSIALGTGTTVEELAKLLVNRQEVTIITPSINIANIFANDQKSRVFLIGGWLRKEDMILYGSYSLDMIRNFYVDKCFVSSAGVSSKYGVTDYFEGEVEVVKELINISKEAYLLADNSKFGNVALLSIAPANTFDAIITDDKSSVEEIKKLRKSNIDIIVVNNDRQGDE